MKSLFFRHNELAKLVYSITFSGNVALTDSLLLAHFIMPQLSRQFRMTLLQDCPSNKAQAFFTENSKYSLIFVKMDFLKLIEIYQVSTKSLNQWYLITTGRSGHWCPVTRPGFVNQMYVATLTRALADAYVHSSLLIVILVLIPLFPL